MVALKLIPRFPSKYSNGATDDLLFLNIIDGQFYSPCVFLKVSSLKYYEAISNVYRNKNAFQ